MKVTLEEFTNPLNLGKYSGICYGREGNDAKRLAHIIDVGHLSVLRFGMAVFKIEGISRTCLAQLTRSKHLDYLVRSSRYCDETNAEFIRPPSYDELEDGVKERINLLEHQMRNTYTSLRAMGVPKQDARYWLPQAQETELYVVGNYQSWVDFVKLRTPKAAQHEVRMVALEIQRQLQENVPEVFK